jgi:hypothetical protein
VTPHLTVWTPPSSYFGYQPVGHIIAATKHRESLILDESNYEVTSERLLKVAQSETFWVGGSIPKLEDRAEGPFSHFDPDDAPILYTWTASCSLVGWIERLMIRPCMAARPIIDEMRRIEEALDGYPVLSDDDYSNRQLDAMYEYWKHESLDARIDWCREADVSIFAARSDGPPEEIEQRWSEEMFA